MTDTPAKSTPIKKNTKKILELKTPNNLWAMLNDIDDPIVARQLIQETLEQYIEQHTEITEKYNLLFLWTDEILGDFELNNIYQASRNIDESKGILLIINSPGGSAESAYLISKVLKNASSKPFLAVIPRKAKSAATLLSLGANEIHMSEVAELGPIDPQLSGMPSLGMQHALDHISALAEKYPNASAMLASYLGGTLSPVLLGYSSRVAESAKQYAERLLLDKSALLPDKQTPADVATSLVYEYKNHGFVIDWEEAQKLLGKKIVKTQTPEIVFSLEIQQYLQSAQLALSRMSTDLVIAGELRDILVIGR